MIMRSLLVATVATVGLSTGGALAADMPQSPAPPPAVVTCSSHAIRTPDKVWRPGQVAYIVAQSCGEDGSLTHWLKKMSFSRRENMAVYYNGGSANRTDIRTINVPIQWQLR